MTEAKRYRTIVADPPWHYEETAVSYASGTRERVPMPYGSMTIDEIKALPVRDMSDNVDDDAHLYLWTTNAYLRASFDVAYAWGFHHSATIVWCKAPTGFSLGGVWPTNSVEFVLFCRRPKVTRRPDAAAITSRLADLAEARGLSKRDVDQHMGTARMAQAWWLSRDERFAAVPSAEHWPRLRDLLGAQELDSEVNRINAIKGTAKPERFTRAPSAWFQWPRGAHSAKPEAFLDLVESVSPGPYLELFARRNRLGWDTWGNEALNHVDMERPA